MVLWRVVHTTVRKYVKDGLQYYTELLKYSREHLMVSTVLHAPRAPLSRLHQGGAGLHRNQRLTSLSTLHLPGRACRCTLII